MMGGSFECGVDTYEKMNKQEKLNEYAELVGMFSASSLFLNVLVVGVELIEAATAPFTCTNEVVEFFGALKNLIEQNIITEM